MTTNSCKQISFPCSVIHHDFNKEPGNLLNMKEALLCEKHWQLQNSWNWMLFRDEEWSKESPQRLKPKI
jgi:hypothetical protein